MNIPPLPGLDGTRRPQVKGDELFGERLRKIAVRTDRLFAWLTVCEWVVGIIFAVWISPRSWAGQHSQVHFHVWAAIFLGGIIAVLPIYLAKVRPGQAFTRHVIAASQMLMAGLLVHLTAGRIETHFLFFGLLAFLAFYRDWRTLATATAVVGLDHLLRGEFWPQSVYGVLVASPWRTLEHVGWVGFEVLFLMDFIQQSRKDMAIVTQRQAEMEGLNERITAEVEARTADLKIEINEREKAERRRQLQTTVSLLLGSAAPMETVWNSILEAICQKLGWKWGALWMVDPEDSVLRFVTCWHGNDECHETLEKKSREIAMAPGIGFPGMIWERGEALWLNDCHQYPLFPRTGATKAENLRAAFGFPVRQEEDAIGVMEFFSDEIKEPDSDLLDLFHALGWAMGSYIGRKQSETAMHESERRYRLMFENNLQPMWVLERESLRFLAVNRAALKKYMYTREEFLEMNMLDLQPEGYGFTGASELIEGLRGGGMRRWKLRRRDGTLRDVEMLWNTVEWNGQTARLVSVDDVTERERAAREKEKMELQLRQSQKLESIGQLAAGIAHEINTPIQYIGDNNRFLADSFREIVALIKSHQQLLAEGKENGLTAQVLNDAAKSIEKMDTEFLLEEIPKAIHQTGEGVERVSTLVAAMKEFSHPGQKEKIPVDLNRAIETTITVARNEWKYVAEMDTELDPSLPQIACLPGELNQVFLNLIVNAAHAIGDVMAEDTDKKGRITVRTLRHDDWVEIQIEDTGGGIPEAVRSRIFDPFFTTKEVGKGTGQGLAIAHSVVVEKHGGSIHFQTQLGKGTTFIIRLPHDGKVLPALVPA